jgi:hypothetical protein
LRSPSANNYEFPVFIGLDLHATAQAEDLFIFLWVQKYNHHQFSLFMFFFSDPETEKKCWRKSAKIEAEQIVIKLAPSSSFA